MARSSPTISPAHHATEECEGQQLRQLVAALCPGIYGHDLVKAGLLLSLFGGVRKNVGSAHRVPIRGDIHVLLVGDPGLGKSQLLQVRGVHGGGSGAQLSSCSQYQAARVER